MASVTFDGASRIYLSAPKGLKKIGRSGKDRNYAVTSMNLEIADGEFLVLVGPSGCGKSTTLRMLAGLEPTDEGRILIGGADATGVAPQDRDVAMVFQNYALYPNMTVEDNMGFALRNRGMAKPEVKKKVQEAAEILELTELLGRKPGQLSGGQRQRVAMGRAIVRDPAVFCMDEPLSNLDAKLRVSTRSQISNLQRRLGTTTVYVTHDQVEAMTMGDRVAVMKDGLLQQVGSPQEIYDAPTNAFVASFIGSPTMNFIDMPAGGDRPEWLSTQLAPQSADAAQKGYQLGIRSEDWEVHSTETPGALVVEIEQIEELGSEAYAYCHPVESRSFATRDTLAVRLLREHFMINGRRRRAGETLWITPTRTHHFDAESGERI